MPPDPERSETHNDAAEAHKPARKPRRFWLFAPYVALAVLAAGWSLAWLAMMGEGRRRMDGAVASLRAAGWTVAWSQRHVGGYPFRLDVDLEGLRLADPSGWAASLPSLKMEAFAFAPTNWVLYVPSGLTFTRPDGGPVNVTAGALRASVSGWGETPPRISLEGDDLTFEAAPGAKPFSVASAKNLQFYTRAGPQQQAALFLSLDGGAARPAGWLGQLAGGKPVAIRLDGIISHTDQLKGDTWRGLVQHWSQNGGTFDVHQLTLTAGDAVLEANKGGVAVADNGQVEGVLEASLRDAVRVMAVAQTGKAPADDPGPSARAIELRLTFRDGGAWLGPVKLTPAPRAY